MTPADALKFEKAIDDAVTAGELGHAQALAADYRAAAAEHSTDLDPGRSPHFRAAFISGRVALAAGHLHQALAYLAPLLPSATRLAGELAGRIHLYLAEAHARLGPASEASRLLEHVPAVVLRSNPLLLLRALRIRLWLGAVDQVAADLATCAAALEARGDQANLALLLCEEGRAWDRAGDLAQAEACWERAERLSGARGLNPIHADVLLQQGRLAHLRGHLAAALDRYGAALRGSSSGVQTLELELRRLLVRLDLGQEDLVRTTVERLLEGTPTEQMPEEIQPLAALVRGLLDRVAPVNASDEVRAYLAALAGDVTAARSLYATALAASPSPERRARHVLSLGLLALNHHDAKEARSWLQQAEGLARSLDLPEVLARTLQVCGQMAAEQEGDDQRARELFEEAVLIADVQAELLPEAMDRASYRWQRSSVLRHLLRLACRRGDAEAVFGYQERERGRLLLDLLHSASEGPARLIFDHPDIAHIHDQILTCEQELDGFSPGAASFERRRELLEKRETLLLDRDRLFEESQYDRKRRDNGLLPALPELAHLKRALPRRTLYVAPALVEDELYLLAVTRKEGARVFRGESGRSVRDALARWRSCLDSQSTRYRLGWPLGRPEREELDQRLDALGQGPLGSALAQALAWAEPRRLLWVPDGSLHGFPIHALRKDGRYLIEDHEVVWTFSGALVVNQAQTRRRRWPFRPAVVVAERPGVLPEAAREGEGVAASFLWGHQVPPETMNRQTLRRWLALSRVVHFACHADFDGRRPLAAWLHLPSKEKIHALEWLDEPVAGLPLVTLSACRSAEVAPLLGQEVFGLVTGLLGGGVRAVLAGLWPVADRETPPLMWSFYRHRLVHDMATALALAQREALVLPDSSPLFWAAFALFGDAAALSPAGPCWRWLARWRQRRHSRRYPSH